MAAFHCPNCGFRVDPGSLGPGAPLTCPSCSVSVVVPSIPGTTAGTTSASASPPPPPPPPPPAEPAPGPANFSPSWTSVSSVGAVGAIPPGQPVPKCSRLVYILLAVFLGQFGIHNFVAGHQARGVLQLALSLIGYVLAFCTLGVSVILPLAMHVWAIVEIVTVTHDDRGVRMN